MSRLPKTFRPHVEMLENRWVPATLRLVGGDLFLSNANSTGMGTDVELTAIANNQFEVRDNGALLATVNVGGRIFYTGTNQADTFTLDLGANTFSGDLFATMGNGADTVDIFATGGALLGNVNVQTGRGNDTVNLNLNGAAMTFGGNVLVFDLLGADTVNVGNGGGVTTFGGSVSLQGTNTIALGAGSADVIGGNLLVQSAREGNKMALTVADNFMVNRNTTVRGTAVADDVTVNLATFNGSASFALGAGDDTFTFATAGLAFNSRLDVDFGEGDDSITLSNAFTVAGNMGLRGGNGDITVDDFNGEVAGSLNVTFGNGSIAFDTIDTAVIAGSVTYRAGNGTNLMDFNNPIGGNLTIMLGHGEGNSTTLSASSSIGGRLIYRGGNGGTALSPNMLVLASTLSVFNLDVRFGNGDDNLSFAGPVTITGRADGGNGNDGLGDTSGVTLLPTLTLSSFEVAV